MSQNVTAVSTPTADERPSCDVLDRLGPGCYVKVGQKTGLFWAEIKRVDGSKMVGRVHQTYEGADQYGINSGQEIKFEKALICETGCDKYCWC